MNTPPRPEDPTFIVRHSYDSRHNMVIHQLQFFDGVLDFRHGPLTPNEASSFLVNALVDKKPAMGLLYKSEGTIHTQTNSALSKLGSHTSRHGVARLFNSPVPLMEVVTPITLTEEPTPKLIELLKILSAPGTQTQNRENSVFWRGSPGTVRSGVTRAVRKQGLRTTESLVMWGFAAHILGGGTPVIVRPLTRTRSIVHEPASPKLVFEYMPPPGGQVKSGEPGSDPTAF
jgi:hypothetical protein